MSAFWGMEIEPNKTYEQFVDEDFVMSMVALGPTLNGTARGSLMIRCNEESLVICSLTPGKLEQQQVDLSFSVGEEISFQVTGENTFHLTGNYLPPADMGMGGQDDYDSEEDEEIDSELEMSEIDEEEMMLMMGEQEESEDEIMLDNSGKIVEVEEEQVVPKLIVKAEKQVKESVTVETKKRAAEETPVVDEAPKKKTKAEKKAEHLAKMATKAAEKQATVTAEPVKATKEAPVRVEKAAPKAVENPAAAEAAPVEEKKKTLPSGIIIEEIKKGDGARAKNGKKILMRYIGKLTNGKEFDSNKSGKPFSFKLGAGEVIKGWDIGVQGMQVGGVRRLTIPPKLAYGAKGAPPDIPKNATLVFDIKMVDVK